MRGAWRLALGGGALTAALLAATQVTPSRLPLGIVVQGAILGTGTGLLAVGLVLTYRATRAINFAYGAIGGTGAALAVSLYTGHGWPWPVALMLAVIVGGAVGGLVERVVIRRFAGAPRLVLTIATIGLAQLLGGAELYIPQMLSTPSVVGGFDTPLDRLHIPIDPVIITGNDVLLVSVVPLVLAGLCWFLLRTDAGTAIRGVSENADRARLLGIPVARLSLLIWIVTGGVAALTVMLAAPGSGLTIDAAAGATVLLPALAAAVVADLESIPIAFVAGVGLGVVDQVVRWNVDKQALETVVFLGVIVLGLLLHRTRRSRVDVEQLSSWSITGSTRPIPVALRHLPEVRAGRLLGIGGLITLAVTLPVLASPSQLDTVSIWLVYGIVALSLVVLTGWGGTVSLGQFGIVGIGALVAGNLISRWNVDLFVSMSCAAIAGALVALLVGLPALRVRGLFLGVTTLAFAVAVDEFFLNPANFRHMIFGDFERPMLWQRFDLRSERTMYALCLGTLVATVLLVRGLRVARSGRALIAVRDNRRGAAALAVPTVRTRLVGFVVAGVIAGVAGALHAVVLRSLGGHTYESSLSLLVFSMAVIGGLTSIGGALCGVALVEVTGYLFPRAQLLITGAGMLVVLLAVPGGLAEAGDRVRDRLLTVVAKRRGIDLVHAAEGPATEAEILSAPVAAADDGTRPALLRCRAVDVGYGALQVLFGADLSVGEGESLALLGTNGAGKSTLLRAVAGLLPIRAGRIELDGSPVHGRPAEHLAARGVALMPGGRGVFPGLTVAENLRLACWLLRADHVAATTAVERSLDLFPPLRARRAVRAGELSGGEQQMLSLAMALATRPRLLCIDELSLGLSPAVTAELVGMVHQVHREGTTVVVVEQSLDVALRLAERAVFLEKGHVRFVGATAELAGRPDLLRAVFLGRRTATAAVAAYGDVAPVAARPLECRGLRRRFGGIVAVDDVHLRIDPGEVVGLIGHNGAGKTTLFDLMTGFVAADGGRVLLGDEDVSDRPAHRRALAGLGRSFQDALLFPSLTVSETVAVALERHLANRDPLAAAMRLPANTEAEAAARERVDELLTLLGLRGFRDIPCGELSTGTRRVVELACILAQEPEVVLLDEPSAGLAQREAEALAPLLRTVREQGGCSMLIIEHDMALLSSVCDRMVALDLGAVIAEGPPDAVLRHPRVISSYLGAAGSTTGPVTLAGARAATVAANDAVH